MLHPTVKLCQSDTYSGGTAFCIFFFFSSHMNTSKGEKVDFISGEIL